jgi:hypothetical protein
MFGLAHIFQEPGGSLYRTDEQLMESSGKILESERLLSIDCQLEVPYTEYLR